MPALNFKAQFAAAVACGGKTQTIRAPRQRPIRAGDTLHLFTGMRTKACRRLRTVLCTAVRPVRISQARVWVDERELSLEEIKTLAVRDGFFDCVAFIDFFCATHGLPFEGQLIEWL